MTDTPRTEAELLTIFADQQNHGITAQDMRDFVVTSVHDTFAAFSVYFAYYDATTAIVTLPGASGSGTWGDTVALTWRPSAPAAHLISGVDYIDPSATRTGAEANAAYPDVVIGTDSIIMIPEGVWSVETFGTVKVADAFLMPPPSGATSWPFAVYIDQVEYDPAFSGPTDGSAPWIYDAFYSGLTDVTGFSGINTITSGGVGGASTFVTGVGRVVQDKAEPQPYAVFAYREHGYTSDLGLVQYGFYLHRVSS